MSSAEAIRSINCTSCGAGLSVLGGGRVAGRVCEYCGTLLDAQDNYKILAEYKAQPRPKTPFDLGMTGVLDGVDWTVIGTQAVSETYEGQRWDWVEHQLYSPTHGYCWLAIEDGHFTFTRKVRGIGNSGWWTEARVNVSDNRPTTYWEGERFQYYECGTRKIEYAAGSFNFTPRYGDRSSYVTFMSATHQLTQTLNGTEREVELTRYLSQNDVQTAFGLDPTRMPDARGVHALQQFEAWAHGKFTRNLGFLFAIAAFVLWLVMIGSSETVIEERDIPTTRPISLSFDVTNIRDLVRFSITSNANNGWAWYDIELLTPDGETLVEFGRQSEYYFGYEDGESWSEGSRTATATLRLPETGTYTWNLIQSEAGTWSNGSRPNRVDLLVEQGVKAPFWLLFTMIVSALAGIVVLSRRMFHSSRRWSGSDWTDEDD